MRIEKLNHSGMEAYLFECPGCKMDHMVVIPRTVEYEAAQRAFGNSVDTWTWNGSMDRPTFRASLLVRWEFTQKEHGLAEKHVCHSFVTDGQIQFLNDCTHALAGQTLDLPEVTQ